MSKLHIKTGVFKGISINIEDGLVKYKGYMFNEQGAIPIKTIESIVFAPRQGTYLNEIRFIGVGTALGHITTMKKEEGLKCQQWLLEQLGI